MKFEYSCACCRHIETIESPIGKVPKVPYHHKRPMKRIYSPLTSQIQWDKSDYVDRAYRGEETVPGMSTSEVREVVDKGFSKVS